MENFKTETKMDIFNAIAPLQKQLKMLRQEGKRIALVPTMGNLHQGHLKLVEVARQHADVVVTTIFVNPLQFAAGEDFEKYPRTFEADCEKLKCSQTDLVFSPEVSELYPEEQLIFVKLPEIQNVLEGRIRPTHFQGMATVVLKLFNIVQPDVACFGKKDYQQWLIIRQMVRQLALPIDIIGVEIERDVDGLALSSRNLYLNENERRIAPNLSSTLKKLKKTFEEGLKNKSILEKSASVALLESGFAEVDYVKICFRENLEPVSNLDEAGKYVVLAAARLGKTRLLDNLEM